MKKCVGGLFPHQFIYDQPCPFLCFLLVAKVKAKVHWNMTMKQYACQSICAIIWLFHCKRFANVYSYWQTKDRLGKKQLYFSNTPCSIIRVIVYKFHCELILLLECSFGWVEREFLKFKKELWNILSTLLFNIDFTYFEFWR